MKFKIQIFRHVIYMHQIHIFTPFQILPDFTNYPYSLVYKACILTVCAASTLVSVNFETVI